MLAHARCCAVVFALAAFLAAPSAWSQTKIDLAIFHPERSAWTPTLKWYVAEVEKATQGRVRITPHYASSLVNLVETLKAVRDGSVPAGMIAASVVTGQIPSFAYLEAIGGLPAEAGAHVEAVTELRPMIEEELRKQGVEYLWSQGSGSLISVCRDRHTKSPEDWKNRKVRTAGRWQAEQLRLVGASPVAMDPSEQYLALQNRTLDCALSVNVLASALKLHEVAPRITQLRMAVNLSSYVVNKGVWDRISAEDQAAMKRLAVEATKRSAEHIAKVEDDAVALMKSQKADVYVVTDQERAAFRKAIGPSFEKMAGEGGETGKKIAAAVKRHW